MTTGLRGGGGVSCDDRVVDNARIQGRGRDQSSV